MKTLKLVAFMIALLSWLTIARAINLIVRGK
jgi:hypothetical protein